MDIAEQPARLASQAREMAYELICHQLGFRPALGQNLMDFRAVQAVSALIEMEKAFGVDLDVDEVSALPDIAALLDLVQARALEAARPSRMAQVYDFAAYRRVVRGALDALDPPPRLDPAVLDRAFPPRAPVASPLVAPPPAASDPAAPGFEAPGFEAPGFEEREAEAEADARRRPLLAPTDLLIGVTAALVLAIGFAGWREARALAAPPPTPAQLALAAAVR